MTYFFDNNISKRSVYALNCLLAGRNGDCARPLLDRFAPNTPDIEWMTKLSKEKDICIITADRNIMKNPSEKKAWEASQKTTFFLMRDWTTNKDLFLQTSKLIQYFPKIQKEAEHAQQGSAFTVNFHGKIKPR